MDGGCWKVGFLVDTGNRQWKSVSRGHWCEAEEAVNGQKATSESRPQMGGRMEARAQFSWPAGLGLGWSRLWLGMSHFEA